MLILSFSKYHVLSFESCVLFYNAQRELSFLRQADSQPGNAKVQQFQIDI